MDLNELKDIQAEFDKEFWEHDDKLSRNIRHITLHMGWLLGKLSRYSEKQEHGIDFPVDQIRDEVMPDLLIYALRLSNAFDVDLEEAFHKRAEENKEKIKKMYSQES